MDVASSLKRASTVLRYGDTRIGSRSPRGACVSESELLEVCA